jgi:N-acetylneuraminic acid mutarotase
VDGGDHSDASIADAALTSGWRTLAPLRRGARQELSVAEQDGLIYVIGGMTVNSILSSVEVYDPASDTWSDGVSLPSPLHHCNVATANGSIYVVGALSGWSFSPVGTVLQLAPQATEWATRTAMPAGTERGASAVGVIDSRILVAGGSGVAGSVGSFSAYNHQTDTRQS